MMFLTRLGDGSRMVVTGDITQTDLPRNKQSGLKEATHVLKDIDRISLFYFYDQDVVRHPLSPPPASAAFVARVGNPVVVFPFLANLRRVGSGE